MPRKHSHRSIPYEQPERPRLAATYGLLAGAGMLILVLVVGLFDRQYHWSAMSLVAIACLVLPTTVVVAVGTYFSLGWQPVFEFLNRYLVVMEHQKSKRRDRKRTP